MKSISNTFLSASLTTLTACISTPSIANTDESRIADTAFKWMKCPPPNPRRPELCTTACCGRGANWDLSCITFVGEIGREARGRLDPELAEGYSKNPGRTFGSAVIAFQAMQRKSRAHYSVNDIKRGSAVFFSIQGFEPGHVAIYSGQRTEDEDPLIITTGGTTWGSGIRIESLSEMSKRKYWRFLGWAEL